MTTDFGTTLCFVVASASSEYPLYPHAYSVPSPVTTSTCGPEPQEMSARRKFYVCIIEQQSRSEFCSFIVVVCTVGFGKDFDVSIAFLKSKMSRPFSNPTRGTNPTGEQNSSSNRESQNPLKSRSASVDYEFFSSNGLYSESCCDCGEAVKQGSHDWLSQLPRMRLPLGLQ